MKIWIVNGRGRYGIKWNTVCFHALEASEYEAHGYKVELIFDSAKVEISISGKKPV